MKKIQLQHFFIALAVISSAFIISCNEDPERPALDFDFTVPDHWTSEVYANEGFIYAAGRNQVDENDSIREVIYITKNNVPGSTLDLYYTNEIRPYILGSTTFVSLLRENDTTINGTDFIKMLSKEREIVLNSAADYDTLDVISEHYVFFENNLGYEILLISLDTLYYQQNHAIFDDIMGTFHYNE